MSLPSIIKLLILGAAAVVSLGKDVFVREEAASLDNNENIGDTTNATEGESFAGDVSEVDEKSHRSLKLRPDLPFGDINLLVVSDVHSHVGGHPHEPDKDADYGDLLSFHERLRDHCAPGKNKGDLWLLNNGDILHGTGLGMDGNATHLLPIVGSLPWDAMAMGRQEATYTDVLRDMGESLLPSMPGTYVTSNVVWNDTNLPYGERYQILRGNHSNVLVFGFLYDGVSASETIRVVPIEEAVQQQWFRTVLRQETNTNADENYDAIVVLAQMDFDSPHIESIYQAIRSNVDPQMPIQFLAGRSHKRERGYSRGRGRQRDNYVHTIEPGGLFDTIGWVTIPKFETAKTYPPKGNGQELQKVWTQEFLNTSKALLHSTLGLKEDQELRTENGTALSEFILETQDELGLNQIVACPGHDYIRNISMYADNSLWKLWRDHVVRTEIFQKDEDRVMLVSKSTLRYDLKGSGKHDAMTLDDVIAIAPYMERVVYVGDVPDWMVRRLNNTLNSNSKIKHHFLPDYVMAGDLDWFQTAESFKLYTHEADVPRLKKALDRFNFHDYVLEYTGQRSTLYWLHYLQTAYPCKGSDKENFQLPYFFDEKELEEESTDGKLTLEDLDTDSDEDGTKEVLPVEDEEAEVWTLPPDGGYQGYVPGKHESMEVSSATYENYKSKEEKDADKRQKEIDEMKRLKGPTLKKQVQDHKKTRRKIVKIFALVLAIGVLLIPVVCLILQVMGRNEYYDNYDESGAMNDMYDREEMRMLKRHRRNGTQPKNKNIPLGSAPFREIEIL